MYIVIVCLIVLLCFCMVMLKEAFRNQIIEENISLADFPKQFGELSFYFISDIHRREISQAMLNQVIERAEFVIIGGDFTEKWVPLKRMDENLRKLSQIGPIYFVWGNNDEEVGVSTLTRLFNKYDVCMLRNKEVQLKKNHQMIRLVGVDDLSRWPAPIHTFIDESDKKYCTILISHNPEIIRYLMPKDHVSLILSGHTHGGQIRVCGFGPYTHGGIHEKNGKIQLISNGYGTTLLPFRLGAKAQTHLITLSNKNAAKEAQF